MASLLPRSFTPEPLVEAAAVLSSGLAMSAAATACFARVDGMRLGLAPTLSTLVLGAMWTAIMLRAPLRGATGRLSLAPWVLGIPLAIANAAWSAGFYFLVDRSGPLDGANVGSAFFGGLFLGPTFGLVLWVPALVATLVAFGPAFLSARRFLQRPVGGPDLAGLVVASASALVSLGAWSVPLASNVRVPGLLQGVVEPDALPRIVNGLAGAAALVALFGATLAVVRLVARERFLRGVAAGLYPGLGVEETTARRAIVRLGSPPSYRSPGTDAEVLLVLDAAA